MLAFLEPLEELADYQEIVRKRGKAEGILQISVSCKGSFILSCGYQGCCPDRKKNGSSEKTDRKEEPGAGYGDHYGRCFFRWTSVKRKIVGKPY